jgi:glycosyltransferase involved in cell wall biosynthesis
VHFIGYTKDEDLPALYSLASLLAFPSLYEGFGLPPLEAMACGTPVVCADNSSLLEAVGDAAMLVDAEDTRGLAEAMARVLGDAELAADLSARGRLRASHFPWRAAAQQLTAAYHSTIEESPTR